MADRVKERTASSGKEGLSGAFVLSLSFGLKFKMSSRSQGANTRPAGRIRPSTLFYPAGTLFLPGSSTELLAPS